MRGVVRASVVNGVSVAANTVSGGERERVPREEGQEEDLPGRLHISRQLKLIRNNC